MTDDIVVRRYTTGAYAERNPDWDSGDSPWKAARIAELLARHGIAPDSIVEIGCGAGGVLANLRERFPAADMAGFDIAPSLPGFWKEHGGTGIRFVVGDYLTNEEPVPDLTLVLDVLEHLGNPIDFLDRLRSRARHVIFHIPLDLSSVSVFREAPLLHVRHKVGHLHYFTKGLALAMLDEAGYEVAEACYTRAAFSVPHRSLKTRLAGGIRRAVFGLLGDAGVRLLGGETLMVLARPRSGA
jgi:SAM-dependent methyltransferase